MLDVARRVFAILMVVCPVPAAVPVAVRAADPPVADMEARRAPFVIGAPGRLDSAGDKRYPRRYQRADSAIAAYADIEQAEDPTWLQHEIETYARRSLDCVQRGTPWCRREIRPLGDGSAIFVVLGERAEIVWAAGRDVAVRLGWRRTVDTPTGSMTLETPPSDFAAALVAEFPNRFTAHPLDAASDGVWAAHEVDRLLYYIDEVVAALPAVAPAEHRRHALRFIENNVAQIARLRARALEPTWGPPPLRELIALPMADALPQTLAEQLEALRAWRAGPYGTPWCAAQLASSAW